MCDLGRVAEVRSNLEKCGRTRIQILQGNTKIWNKGGHAHFGWEDLEASARMVDPNAMVTSQTQSKVEDIGMPCWQPDFVQDQFSKLSDRHDILLGRIAMVEDLQSAWFLVCCAAARANFFLRSVSPGQISPFVSHHDDEMWSCFSSLLGIDPASVAPSSRIGATLPLRFGGLALSRA